MTLIALGDFCSNGNTYILGQDPLVKKCTYANSMKQFTVCGTLANFVNTGPDILDGCGLELSINGVNYPGEALDDTDVCGGTTCPSAGSFANSYGMVLFKNVPICE